MKKIWLVVFLLTVSLLYGQSEEAFDIVQNREGGITITGYTGSQMEVAIPARISGIPVTIIGRGAFDGKGLTKVTLPGSLVTIEERAFADNQLAELDVPNGVKVIWNEAFAYNRIARLILPNSLTDIGSSAFRRNRLAEVSWPSGVAFMRTSVFRDNPIATISLGGAKNVLDMTFEGSDATTVTIGSGVTIDGMSGLDRSFINFYNNNGKKAGTYARNGRIWAIR